MVTPERVYYAWGDGSAARLQRVIDLTGRDAIAIHLNDLRDAFFDGMAAFEQAIQADPQRYEGAASRAGLWLRICTRALSMTFSMPSTITTCRSRAIPDVGCT